MKKTWIMPLVGAASAGFFLLLTATAGLAAGRLQPTLPLPTPSASLPLSTPSLPALPTPSVPTLDTPPIPTPSLPVSLTPTPPSSPASPTPPVGGVGSGGTGPNTAGGNGPNGGSGPGHGLSIPFTSIVISSPLDVALLGAFAVLPLLFGIWLLLFGRTWAEARRSRDAQIRLAIANELGLSPRELVSIKTKSLFKLREEAAFDELTGVLRRAAGISALDRELHRARRQKSPLAVVFIDVDGLKQANDTRGHKAGDDLLRTLASLLKSGLRGQDLVLRYGGDEFVCVLPDTVADGARAKMSWIQTEAEKSSIAFSIGVAQLERSDDVVSLLARADQEMYAVKARRGKIQDLRLGVIGGSGGSKRVPA